MNNMYEYYDMQNIQICLETLYSKVLLSVYNLNYSIWPILESKY